VPRRRPARRARRPHRTVLLGDGVRLYGEAVTRRAPIALERADLADSGRLTTLRFRVKR
jgi:hypothetical protein